MNKANIKYYVFKEAIEKMSGMLSLRIPDVCR